MRTALHAAIPALQGIALLLASVTTSLAGEPPPASRNYAANYQTLLRDSHAPPDVAACVATGHDLVLHGGYDRLGFTAANLAAATRPGAGVVTLAGIARKRNGAGWDDITLRCQLDAAGKVKDIVLAKR